VGDEIATGEGRLGMRHAQGLSLRLDRVTRVSLVGIGAVRLLEGAVYVDSSPGNAPITIETSMGSVRDVGTQFEVRVAASALSVRVRSGLIEVRRGPDVYQARAGTELTVGRRGASTSPLPVFGASWDWVSAAAPPFAADGQTLGALLDHLSREQGWTIVWADPQLAASASGIVLHGSLDGLAPLEQLGVALSTSGLAYAVEDGTLTVSRARR
jgi:ferric-dicitrate binding protein FerR (iron transport regulator)